MREDYYSAYKIAEETVRRAKRAGKSPYLPVLSPEIEKEALGTRHIGLMELPICFITGNKEEERNNAFASDFMPLMSESSEFAAKWTALYDSYVQEGIRDAIKVYEYMHKYYVQEGNKRVSVSKFGGSEYILADVERILPKKSDDREVRAYYEYLDFYEVTRNFNIILNEPGEYEKLARLFGQTLTDTWPTEAKEELREAFFLFLKGFKTVFKDKDNRDAGEAFLVYISIFPYKTLLEGTNDQIVKNIRLAKSEFVTGGSVDDIEFIHREPREAKTSILTSLFSGPKNYTKANPLRVAYIYDTAPENSRWIDSHESGRLYVEAMTGENVVTKCYYAPCANGSIADALSEAIEDKNEIIFTVKDIMMAETLKEAVLHPEIRFLNCSIGQTASNVHCYHGKLYEATFLMGILAANTLLRTRGSKSENKIGYIARYCDNLGLGKLNAFAIGASMMDPDCRIDLKICTEDDEDIHRKEWEDAGISIYADFEYAPANSPKSRPGLYRIEEGKTSYIGSAYYAWGKYYLQLVHSVLCGTYNENRMIAKNYWFGLSTGVVDIRTPDISKETQYLLDVVRRSVSEGVINPLGSMLSEIINIRISDADILGIGRLYDNIDGNYEVKII